MKTIRNIRRFLGNYDLRRKSRQLNREKKIHNFTTAGTAGIVFHCRSEEEFEAVKDFKTFLESESIRTDVLGYVDEKEVPDHYLLRKGYNFICRKDLNWYYRPDSAFSREFTGKTYDLLFDLSLADLFPVDYMVALSPAAFKIGRLSEKSHFDLMIDIRESASVAFLLEQVRHYLSILHTSRSTVRAD